MNILRILLNSWQFQARWKFGERLKLIGSPSTGAIRRHDSARVKGGVELAWGENWPALRSAGLC